jgi:hypothetical protein
MVRRPKKNLKTNNMTHIFLYAIVPIFVVILVGYIAGRRGVFGGEDASRFNKVVLNYALPAALFVSIVDATRQELARDAKLAAVAAITIIGTFMLVYFIFKYCFKENTGAEAAVSSLISGSPTIGFLGFAVLEPIFGTSPTVALVIAIVGIVVNAIGIPLGLSLLNASIEKRSSDAKHQSAWSPVVHALSQPVAWAPILAVVWVIVGIPWPGWASPSFDLIAKANASLAVFSAGITLSTIRFTVNIQVILGSVMKMLVMPAVALLLGLLIHMEPTNLRMLVLATSLPPAFSGVIIAEQYKTYVATGTSSLTLSILLFILTCPFWLTLTDRLLS